MSKADKMFEELGLKREEQEIFENWITYHSQTNKGVDIIKSNQKETYMYNNKPVKLHGIFQRSTATQPYYPVNPGYSGLISYPQGGVVAYPVAVIELENGEIREVFVSAVTRINKQNSQEID